MLDQSTVEFYEFNHQMRTCLVGSLSLVRENDPFKSNRPECWVFLTVDTEAHCYYLH